MPGSKTALHTKQRTAEKEVGKMMTLTGEWNALVNAFPAFADSAGVASDTPDTWRSAAVQGLRRR